MVRLVRVAVVLATLVDAVPLRAASWTSTGLLDVARSHHTATVLSDGRVLVVGGATTSVEIYSPADSTWSSAASLPAARERHTATLLPGGKVLIAGGSSGSVAIATALLYDASSDTWNSAGTMTAARMNHTATLLTNGKVLVASLTSSEIYDPATNAWTAVDDLVVSRESHTATLLADGRVLLAGGLHNAIALASAEIYDPAADTWTATGNLTTARSMHTATLLANGKVLVAGSTSAELYDPANGTWTATGSLAIARAGHTATLLGNGKVVVTGGSASLATAEEYDPNSGAWTSTATPAVHRVAHTATLLASGKVLVAGGSGSDRATELYDSSTPAIELTTTQLDEFEDHTATLLPNGKVLVAGGSVNAGSARTTAYLFDPSNESWSAATSMIAGTCEHTATLLPDGTVLVVAGRPNASSISWQGSTDAQLYDSATNSWRRTGSLAFTRFFHTATLLPNGKVLVAGGREDLNLPSRASAEIYDPSTGTWSVTGSMASGRQSHTATLMDDGRVLVTGGTTGGGSGAFQWLASAEIYDPSSGAWTATGSMNSKRGGHTATLLPNGNVLVTGGCEGGSGNVPNPFGDSICTATTELFDPSTGAWSPAAALPGPRCRHTATLLPAGLVVVIGGSDVSSTNEDARITAIYDPAIDTWSSIFPAPGTDLDRLPAHGHASVLLPDGRVVTVAGHGEWERRGDTWMFTPDLRQGQPVIDSVTTPIIDDATITGSNFLGTGAPLIQIQSIQSERISWLVSDATLHVSTIPPDLDLGWHRVTLFRDGVPSISKLTEVRSCHVAIVTPPENATVAAGLRATFSVVAEGARGYQWQKDGVDIPGAITATYVTPPVVGADSGSRYRCRVIGTCSNINSAEAVLTVADSTAPSAAVLSPSGGEYWLLSNADGPANTELVTWSMSDNVRICRVEVSLLYSSNGGTSYVAAPAGGGLPATFGPGGTCANPGEGTTSVTYTVPESFPSGIAGSLYKIAVKITDHAGQSMTVHSANPFYVVQSNPDSVRTLILANPSRMQALGIASAFEAGALSQRLQELANHPRVQGRVIDIGGVSAINTLYATWDADPANASKANAVLFGSGGIHEYLRTSLLPAYSGVKYVVLVGDDRVIPMARVQDRTALLPESSYPAGGDLTPTGTTVGQALAAGKYLSDDPLAVLDPIAANQLDGSLYLPDFALGRLVETPQEIITTIATYISQDGILDLSILNASTGHKVLVTGYDFLSNVARQMRNRWKSALGVSTTDTSTAPVDGSLIGGNWRLGSVSARSTALRTRLAGNGGPRYAIASLAGHATHYEEGVPGTNPFDIQGLFTSDIYGADSCGTPTAGAINLAGSVVYAVGCHGGLSVPGSCRTDANHSLDLPQTMLGRGAVAYLANSGYGWGLKFGIGYSARLVQIFTEQMTSRASFAVGDLIRSTKQQYFLETPRYDSYDEKTTMQWMLSGLPMYVVKTGVAATSAKRMAIRTQSQEIATLALPPSLTQLNLSFDFTAPGVYDKHDSEGNVIGGLGCPDANGCYYTLNGLVDRGTGSADLPIQPYLIYDSRLSGSSQHGALWKGGTYDEQSGWTPVIAELASNGGDGSNHGSAPRFIRLRPTTPRIVPGTDSADCRPTDLEMNSLTVTAGEAVKNQDSDPTYSITRLYRSIDLEVFYFNNRTTPSDNCDRAGPALGAGPFAGEYHQISGSNVMWAIPVSDPAGVWRIVVVYNRNTIDAEGRGSWLPLELTKDESGIFRGSVPAAGSARLTYLLQAVDNRGNVTWLEYVTANLPSSGVPLSVPRPVDVALPASIAAPTGVIATAASSTSATLTWMPIAGAARYDIHRRSSGSAFVKIGTTTATHYTDSGLAASTAHLYSVQAIDAANNVSTMSAADLATTVIFTHPTITSSVTRVQAVHFTELRTAVNAVRSLAGLAPFTFPMITPGVTKTLAAHVSDLRSALAAARTTLSLPAVPYSDGTITPHVTPMKAVHITELRSGVR